MNETAEFRFPKPDPARAFADLKIVGPRGDPLRTPVQDWVSARQRVAGDPAWAKWLADMRAGPTIGWQSGATGSSGSPAGSTISSAPGTAPA
jgi:hypothetical protein